MISENISEDNKWEEIKPTGPIPRARYSHSATLFEKKIFIFGGCTHTKQEKKEEFLNDVWIFNISTKSWEQIKVENKPSPRASHSAAKRGQEVYIFGGRNQTKSKSQRPKTNVLNDLWVFNLKGKDFH